MFHLHRYNYGIIKPVASRVCTEECNWRSEIKAQGAVAARAEVVA